MSISPFSFLIFPVLKRSTHNINISNSRNLVKHFPKHIQKRLPKEVAFFNISPKESQRLNRLYRKKNKATNVLSFRYGPDYGEILLCPDIIKKEAREQGNSQNTQMTRMVIHAMLHLGEVHHEKGASQEKRFAKLEGRIVKSALGGNLKVKIQKSK